jgi:hypothetical protein
MPTPDTGRRQIRADAGYGPTPDTSLCSMTLSRRLPIAETIFAMVSLMYAVK